MSEQVGDHIDAAAGIGDVGGERVPQLVRADRRVQPGPARGRSEQLPDRVGRIGAPIAPRNRFTNTKSLPTAARTGIRSNS